MRSFKTLLIAVFIGIYVSLFFQSCVTPIPVVQTPSDSVNIYWDGYWKAYYLNANYSDILNKIKEDYNDSLLIADQNRQKEINILKIKIDSLRNLPSPDDKLIDSLEQICNEKLETSNQLANNYWRNYYELLFNDSTKHIDTVIVTNTEYITITKYDTIRDTIKVIEVQDPIIKYIYDTIYVATSDTLWKTKIDTIYIPKVVERVDTLWRTIYDTIYTEKIDTIYLQVEPTVPYDGVSLRYIDRDVDMDSIRMILAPVYINKAVEKEENYLYKKSNEMIYKYNFITDSLLIYQIGKPITEPVQLHPIGTTESDIFTSSNGESYPGSKTIDGITSQPCYGDVNQPDCNKKGRYTISGYPHWIEYTFENTYYFTSIKIDVYNSEKDYVHGVRLYADGKLVEDFITTPTSGGNIWSRQEIGFNAKRIRMEIYDLKDALPVGLKQNGWTDIWEVEFFGKQPYYPTQAIINAATSSENRDILPQAYDGVYFSNIPDSISNNKEWAKHYWAEKGFPKWAIFELDRMYNLTKIQISFFYWNNGRQYTYDLKVSSDGLVWKDIVVNKLTDYTEWQTLLLDGEPVKFIKLIGKAQNQNEWMNVWEIRAFE